MNVKCLVAVSTASIAIMVYGSVVQAQSFVVSPKENLTVSWDGLYIGFRSGQTFGELRGKEQDNPNSGVGERESKNLEQISSVSDVSGFLNGLYVGYNIDLNGFVLGLETNIDLSQENAVTADMRTSTITSSNLDDWKKYLNDLGFKSSIGLVLEDGKAITEVSTMKSTFAGSTQLRAGFSLGRIMPYISGGIAYAQIQKEITINNENTFSPKEDVPPSTHKWSHTVAPKDVQIGYTLGGGFDAFLSNNIMIRAEYRFTDFVKSTNFIYNKVSPVLYLYRVNNLRVGFSYKL